MSKEFIQLADNTVVDDSYVVQLSAENIAVYVKGRHTIREMKDWFDDPNRTKVMHSDQYGDKQTWTGFTELTHVEARDAEAYVCLMKS